MAQYVLQDNSDKRLYFELAKDLSEKYINKYPDSVEFLYWNLANMSNWAKLVGLRAISKLGGAEEKIINKVKPDKLLIPFPYDAHHDHRISFECMTVFFKSFRYSFIKEVWMYETLSETNFTENYTKQFFQPNTWVDITDFYEKKIKIFHMICQNYLMFIIKNGKVGEIF